MKFTKVTDVTIVWLRGVLKNLLRCTDLLFEKHKFVRRILVFWSLWLITWATLQMFADISIITDAAAAAYTVLVGVLGVVLGFYQWMRERDDNNGKA